MAKLRDYLAQAQDMCRDLEQLGIEYRTAKQVYEQLYNDPAQVPGDITAQLCVGDINVPIPVPALATLEEPLFEHVNSTGLTIAALWRKLADVTTAAVAHITTVEQEAQVIEPPTTVPVAPLQPTLSANLPPAAAGWDGAATEQIGS